MNLEVGKQQHRRAIKRSRQTPLGDRLVTAHKDYDVADCCAETITNDHSKNSCLQQTGIMQLSRYM